MKQHPLAAGNKAAAIGTAVCRAYAAGRLTTALLIVIILSACAGFDSDTSAYDPSAADTNVQTASPAVSLQDGDSDGVEDSLDNCSNTLALHPVDEQGCELFSGTLENVEFRPDAYQLDENSEQALNQLVARMQTYPDVVLAISGHTDNRGNARDNLELSKKRVLAVVRYLVLNGVNGRRLQPHGYGESRPIFSNATEAGRRGNRRIEITLIPPN